MISELSWSEYSLVEDVFVDPNTPMARRNIDFHSPVSTQLEKIVHDIRGDLYHEDSGTLSDMDSSSSETTIAQVEEMPGVPVGNDCNMADDFSIEVGGFAITCESEKEDTKGHDYMYEIGTKFIEPFTVLQETSENRSYDTVTLTLPLEASSSTTTTTTALVVSQESSDLDTTTVETDSAEEPAVLPSSPRQARPRSAPTLRSFQQRKSSRIQLKSFSTTSLVPHQPPAATMQKQVAQYHSHTSMSEEFPRWLYSEVVKAGIQFCKPNFVQSPSTSSISSVSDSDCADEESTADSTDELSMQVSADQQSTKTSISEQASTDQHSTKVSTSQQSAIAKASTDQRSTKTFTDRQPIEVSIDQQPVPMNGTASRSPVIGISQSNSTPRNTKSKEQFDHYGAICYLWRGKQFLFVVVIACCFLF